MLREFEAADFWEGGNPPPKVWDALWCILGGEGGVKEQDVIHAFRYWHCPRYRVAYLGKERRERKGLEAQLEKVVDEGLWVAGDEESEGSEDEDLFLVDAEDESEGSEGEEVYFDA